jgi:hypothetical protein
MIVAFDVPADGPKKNPAVPAGLSLVKFEFISDGSA